MKEKKSSGRPMEHSNNVGYFSALIGIKMQQRISDEDARTYGQAIVDKQVDQAVAGNISSVKWISDKLEGRTAIQMDLFQAVQIVYNAARTDMDALERILKSGKDDLRERIKHISGPVVADNPDMPRDLDEALVTLERAAQVNPAKVRELIMPLINNYDTDSDHTD